MTTEKRHSLRDRYLEQTREQILKSFVDCLAEQAADDVSTARLAERAEVSERTVYRHFPTRVDLLAAAGEWINANVFSLIGHTTAADRSRAFREACRRFDAQPHLARAIAVSRMGRSVREGFRADLQEHGTRVLREEVPHLPEQDIRRAAAVTEYLDNVLAWTVMRDEFGMTGQETADAVAWVLDLVLDDLRRRDEDLAGQAREDT